MSQTITRLFDSAERANAAAQALRDNRIRTFDDVHVIGGGAGANGDGVADAISRALVLKAHASILAEGVKRGGAVVVVHAPFGSAADAIEILDSHGPIDSGLPDDREPPLVWDEAAPCSSALHLRVLIDDSATFSTFWNVPPLVKSGGTTSAALGLPEIKDTRGPFTGTVGLPLLSSNATPLSSLLGLPLLKNARSAR